MCRGAQKKKKTTLLGRVEFDLKNTSLADVCRWVEPVTHCRLTGCCRSLIFIATEKQFTGLFFLRQLTVGTRLCTATVSRNCVPLLRYTKQTTTPFGVVVCLCLGNENQTIILLFIHLRWCKYS